MLRTAHSAALTALLVSVLLAGGCDRNKTSDRNLRYVDPDKAVTLVGEQDPVLGIGKGKHGKWIDPRGETAFREGHIPGALNMSFRDVADEHENLFQYTHLVVYGDHYNDPLAIAMSKRLIELKHKNVYTLEGGLKAWTDAGHELDTGD